jgi:hypothetical protein
MCIHLGIIGWICALSASGLGPIGNRIISSQLLTNNMGIMSRFLTYNCRTTSYCWNKCSECWREVVVTSSNRCCIISKIIIVLLIIIEIIFCFCKMDWCTVVRFRCKWATQWNAQMRSKKIFKVDMTINIGNGRMHTRSCSGASTALIGVLIPRPTNLMNCRRHHQMGVTHPCSQVRV